VVGVNTSSNPITCQRKTKQHYHKREKMALHRSINETPLYCLIIPVCCRWLDRYIKPESIYSTWSTWSHIRKVAQFINPWLIRAGTSAFITVTRVRFLPENHLIICCFTTKQRRKFSGSDTEGAYPRWAT